MVPVFGGEEAENATRPSSFSHQERRGASIATAQMGTKTTEMPHTKEKQDSNKEKKQGEIVTYFGTTSKTKTEVDNLLLVFSFFFLRPPISWPRANLEPEKVEGNFVWP